MTNRAIDYWVIPPECDAEFVAHMENVLETYEKPYNSNQPVICMDEQPVQLIKETRQHHIRYHVRGRDSTWCVARRSDATM